MECLRRVSFQFWKKSDLREMAEPKESTKPSKPCPIGISCPFSTVVGLLETFSSVTLSKMF